MKRLLLTSAQSETDAVRSNYNILSQYSSKICVDFKPFILENVEDRHASWIRVFLISLFLDTYDEIVWLDSDVLIKSPTTNVFDFLRTPESSAIIYSFSDTPDPSTSIFLVDCSNKELVKKVFNDWWCNSDNEKEFDAVWKKTITLSSTLFSVTSDTKILNDTHPIFFKVQQSLYKHASHSLFQKYWFKTQHPMNKRIAMIMRFQNFYTNGAGQNCVFMKHVFEAVGCDVDMVSYSSEKIASPDLPYEFKNFKDLNLDDYDVFFFGSLTLTTEDTRRVREKGIRCIMFNPCNVVDGFHIENFVYKEKSSTTPLFEMNFHKLCDEVWMTKPNYESSYEYLQVVNRFKVPIVPVPLAWNPLFLQKNSRLPCYEKRTASKIDFCIMEPNIGYCKNAWIPLIICEKFYLENPTSVGKVYLFSTPEANPTAMGMIRSLKLSEDGKIKLMTRMPVNDILSFFSSSKNTENHVVFVSHNINIPVNYAYYDILYSGFPFIHNSKVLKTQDLGFYYDSLSEATMNIQKGTSLFQTTVEKNKAEKYLAQFNPYHPVMIETFTKLLDNEKLTHESLRKKLQIYIVSCSEIRKAHLTKMLKDLKITFDVSFYSGYTPETSRDYLNYRNKEMPENDKLICCSRSHIGAMVDFLSKFPRKEYILILEDDVTMIKEGFEYELVKAINKWIDHMNEIDYLNIGYLFKKPLSKKQDDILHWDMSGEGGTLWGAQGYVIKRNILQQMVEVLNQPTAQDLYNAIFKYHHIENKGVLHSPKKMLLSPDHYLSILWRQGYINPMLVMEDQNLQSLIWEHKNDFRAQVTKCDWWLRKFTDFYIPETETTTVPPIKNSIIEAPNSESDNKPRLVITT
jgi:GR25 family glycosyltransferase involved in LPS biosynthesis